VNILKTAGNVSKVSIWDPQALLSVVFQGMIRLLVSKYFDFFFQIFNAIFNALKRNFCRKFGAWESLHTAILKS